MESGDSLREAEDRKGGKVLLQRYMWCPAGCQGFKGLRLDYIVEPVEDQRLVRILNNTQMQSEDLCTVTYV